MGEKRPDARGQMRCCRGMGAKQDDAGVFEWGAALESDLPEVLVESQQDSRFGLGEFQKSCVWPTDTVCSRPDDIVPAVAKDVDKQTHLCGDWIGAVFVSQIAGIGQAGQNVLSGETWIVLQKIAFGFTGCQQFEDELHGETSPADHGLAREDLRIYDNSLGKCHDYSLNQSRGGYAIGWPGDCP